MKITIENYIIETTRFGLFNLIDQRKSTSRKGEDSIYEHIVAYNISLPLCIKKIIALNLHENPNIVSLRQFVVDYRNEVKKIEKLLDLENIKNK